MELIDKDALVAEIDRIIKEGEKVAKEVPSSAIFGLIQAYKNTLSILDTIEVKEVDLEKEHKDWLHQHFNGSRDHNASGDYLKRSSQLDMAKHFFELGLKAQHDNWKVVGDTNLPQADKNKIYCVLSKNKYLLARVIDHPHDELLQWKCTEFPFHRYDMCEGDKYMQIG